MKEMFQTIALFLEIFELGYVILFEVNKDVIFEVITPVY